MLHQISYVGNGLLLLFLYFKPTPTGSLVKGICD